MSNHRTQWRSNRFALRLFALILTYSNHAKPQKSIDFCVGGEGGVWGFGTGSCQCVHVLGSKVPATLGPETPSGTPSNGIVSTLRSSLLLISLMFGKDMFENFMGCTRHHWIQNFMHAWARGSSASVVFSVHVSVWERGSWTNECTANSELPRITTGRWWRSCGFMSVDESTWLDGAGDTTGLEWF